MVLNDIIADYEFIYKNLIRCEDYFKIGQSIIDNTTLQLMPTATLMPKQLFQYLCKDT